MKVVPHIIIGFIFFCVATGFAQQNSENGNAIPTLFDRLFILKDPEKNGNQIVKLFRVDKDGKTTILYSVNPGGTDDPASEYYVIPDLMTGQFKINKSGKLLFYTSDKARYYINRSGNTVDRKVNPIMFFSNQYLRQYEVAKDSTLKASLMEKSAFMNVISDAKEIEYIYNGDCKCFIADVSQFENLPEDHLYQGRIFPIDEKDKTKYSMEIIMYRHRLFPIDSTHCALSKKTEPVFVNENTFCSLRLTCQPPNGFTMFYNTYCSAKYCNNDASVSTDIPGCLNDNSIDLMDYLKEHMLEKTGPDFITYLPQQK